MNTEQMLEIVIASLDELKARDVKIIDVREKTSVTDLMVIASGTSERHVRSLAARVVEDIKKHGVLPLGVEGEKGGDWVLVDLGDLVLHVMLPQTRAFYQLEKLWDFPYAAAEATPV